VMKVADPEGLWLCRHVRRLFSLVKCCSSGLFIVSVAATTELVSASDVQISFWTLETV